MRVTEEKKHQYWNHFVTDAYEYNEFPNRVTGRRLKHVKMRIWNDQTFWGDVVFRHGAEESTPIELRDEDGENYEHCKGNFWGMIMQELVESGILGGY